MAVCLDGIFTATAVFEAQQLRHPAMLQGEFVPNNIRLGDPNFAVITGPNMGGKSTLIRQASLQSQHRPVL